MILSIADLYFLAWYQPMTSVARVLGISDQALIKACRRRGVQIPQRGHWARVRAGVRVTQPSPPTELSNAPDFQVMPPAEAAVVELLRLARGDASTNREAVSESIPAKEARGGTPVAQPVHPSVEALDKAARPLACGTVSSIASTSCSALAIYLTPWNEVTNLRTLLAAIQARSAELPRLQRLKVEAWLAQNLLELEARDPISQIVVAVLERPVLPDSLSQRGTVPMPT